ncbi:MAG: methyl-accepting chemotaxis protein [Parasulfuritortus sp.]|jgi:twitching motility protein PilJ|nr:methyl-accepting chemotaxis protein [Parasulfuritortus sp.]
MGNDRLNTADRREGKAGLGAWLSGMQDSLLALDPAKVPILKGMSVEKRYQTLVLGMIVSVLLTVVFMVLYVVQLGHKSGYIEVASNLQMQSQRYSKNAQLAVMGNKMAFTQLKQSQQSFASGLSTLIDGGNGLPSAPASMQGDLASVQKRWDTSRKDIDTLLTQQEALQALNQAIVQINDQEARLAELAERAGGGGKLDLWSQRMAKNANELLASDTIKPEVAYQLSQDMQSFAEAQNGMAGSDELKAAFAGFQGAVDKILKDLPKLVEAKRAARELFDESEQMLTMTARLAEDFKSSNPSMYLALSLIFGLLALLSLVMLSLVNVAESRERAELATREQDGAAKENRRNQEAILRLLNEMGDLAEGNLTVRATVTEDITGAIADSVNFAIEELRNLVDNVSRAVIQVTQATDDAKSMSQEMLAASERQAEEIGRTTESVNFMSESVNNVSKNAADSSLVAEQSLEFARKGGDSVRNAIAGMNSIRDQIQETSKRIKRLGESSQEIGEIVELISDITEQTNVLALNAAIQAAAAGEAGRGFSVVAEEVQRLAERSGQATRRIGAIVKTIQTDTQDTINAMETSTRGVVEGAVLSDTAGRALQDIESVSEKLAGLIQNISDGTREQADVAARIAGNMRQILEQTQQASEGTRKSADSIGQLTVLADELRVSVSGFTL